MVYTLLELRKMAELNLTPECYKKYLALIEPGVQQMLHEYFRGWQNVETYLKMAVMKHYGVYKTNVSVFNLEKEEYEKNSEYIEVKKYAEVDRWNVATLIDYLFKNKVIEPNTYKLFHYPRKRRNIIHKSDGKWSEQDLIDFEWAGSMAHFVYLGQLEDSLRLTTRDDFRKRVENTAIWLMNMIEKRSG